MQRNRVMGLRIYPKLLIGFIAISLIPMFGLAYQIAIHEADMQNTVKGNLTQKSDLIAKEINGWVDNNVRMLNFIAEMEDMVSMVPVRQIPILKMAEENYEWVSLLFVADLEGNAIARSDNKALKNYRDREYVSQVLQGAKVGQQVLIGKVNPVPLQCLSVPIKYKWQKRGILTQCSTLVDISKQVVASRIGKTGYAFLVDEKQRLIAHGANRGKLEGQLQDFDKHPALLGGQAGEVKIIEREGSKQVAYSRDVGMGWKLVILQDYSEAFAASIAAKHEAVFLVLITVGIILLVTVIITRNISNPIIALTSITDELSRGHFAEEIPGGNRADEIGDLALAIERMGNSIKIATCRLQQKNLSSQRPYNRAASINRVTPYVDIYRSG